MTTRQKGLGKSFGGGLLNMRRIFCIWAVASHSSLDNTVTAVSSLMHSTNLIGRMIKRHQIQIEELPNIQFIE